MPHMLYRQGGGVGGYDRSRNLTTALDTPFDVIAESGPTRILADGDRTGDAVAGILDRPGDIDSVTTFICLFPFLGT